jgi:hypothetical protein
MMYNISYVIYIYIYIYHNVWKYMILLFKKKKTVYPIICFILYVAYDMLYIYIYILGYKQLIRNITLYNIVHMMCVT